MSTQSSKEEIVMYLLLRTDLKMSKGKLCAQAAHASQLAIRAAEKGRSIEQTYLQEWERGSFTKIALRLTSEEHLRTISAALDAHGITHAVVKDEGRTEIPAGSMTAIGVGPLPKHLLAEALGTLDLL